MRLLSILRIPFMRPTTVRMEVRGIIARNRVGL